MGLGGFIQHSINVIKQNRNLRNGKKPDRRSLSENSASYGESGNPKYLEKLMKFRAVQRKKEALKYRILFIVFMIVLLISLYFLTQKYYSPHFG